MTVSARYGLGNHQTLLSYENIVKPNPWSWIGQVVAVFDLVVARIAVVAFLLSIQSGTVTKTRYILLRGGNANSHPCH